MVGSTDGYLQNSIELGLKVSTRDLEVAEYFEIVTLDDDLRSTEHLYKRPDVRVFALVFPSRTVRLSEPVKRKALSKLVKRLRNNIFSESMLLAMIPNEPVEADFVWRAAVALHTKVEALERKYGGRPVFMLVNAGIPNFTSLEHALENNIDSGLIRSIEVHNLYPFSSV